MVDMSSTDGTLEMLEYALSRGADAARRAQQGLRRGRQRRHGQVQRHPHMCLQQRPAVPRGIGRPYRRAPARVGDDTLLGFRLEGRDGVLQRSALYFPGRLDLIWMFSATVRSSWNLTFRLGRFMADWDITERTPVDWVTGAALAASRALWQKTGGFDEEFFMFSEEVDLCRRVHDLGGTVFYVPEVALTHVGGASMDSTDLKVQWLTAGKVRYTRKHHGHVVLFVARLGATAAYLSSFPIWMWRWLRRAITTADLRAQVRRYGKALLKAWTT